MDQSTQTAASFTGTLLKHEHRLGQKFVQLVFRENNKNVLCVSTDPRMAALKVGQLYHVEGTFTYRGERPFVFDPKIAALKKHWIPVSRAILTAGGIVCFVVVGTAILVQGSPAKPVKATPTVQAITPAANKVASPQPTTAGTTKPTATPAPSTAPTYYAPVVFRQASKSTPASKTSTTNSTPASAAPAVMTTPVTPQAPAAPLAPNPGADSTDTTDSGSGTSTGTQTTTDTGTPTGTTTGSTDPSSTSASS